MKKVKLLKKQFMLPADMCNALRTLAFKERLSQSEIIRRAVDAYLKKGGK